MLSACATAVLSQKDLDTRAPELPGFGQSDVPVTTRSARARQLFNQGVLQAYAFNEHEAERMFKAALAADPDCAMCAWGFAWQRGPNINNTGRDRLADALAHVDMAVAADRATPRERALVEALALRYAHGSALKEIAPLTTAHLRSRKTQPRARCIRSMWRMQTACASWLTLTRAIRTS